MALPTHLSALSTAFSHLPRRQRPTEFVPLVDGRVLCSGATGLYVLTPTGETAFFPWWRIQRMLWVAELRAVSVIWSDPAYEALRGEVSGEAPESFMRASDGWIRSSMVSHRSETADNGTLVTVQIRREEAGRLICVSTADGVLDSQGESLVKRLEMAVCEAVGLDLEAV